MIIWVNGAFGAGKSGAAREMLDLVPESTLYEPEVLGGCLRQLLPEKRLQEVTDYQDLAIWRRLVVETAASLLAEVGGVLITPMTLLRQEHRDEIFGGLAARGIEVRHVLLDPGETILRARIAARTAGPDDPGADDTARRWALDRVVDYTAALPWLAADAHVIDTAGLDPRQTAVAVTEAIGRGEGVCGIVQTPEPRAETVAAGVLLFDDADRVLLVDPTYKPGWEFPGGIVERGESPSRAGHREVAEELGIELPGGLDLLVVDWEPPQPPGHGGLRLLFDGGRMPSADIGRLLLPEDELRGWRFVTEDEAAGLLPPVRLDRLRWALRAREQGRALSLEAGHPAR
ncbi:putative ATP/GTP-binding protein [Actinacidiphila reveromycinica]|uniref:Putative ATP/GTP-binding protein n=1 Tax=Actinacidiphila reveromycinica TaxID=659352 RepID=A0A7U3UZZ9_9ACTN|nr:NUDIX hydrolase [Streptomyces sp. SN-593]BBB01704.1 putative ATP/GTP-binding protein [Streptomyces sp. SN-593]